MEQKNCNKLPINLPSITGHVATTISEQLISVLPEAGPQPLRTYEDHMGNTVTEYVSGGRTTHSYSSTHLYGEYGHSFLKGFYVVDENGEMVFAGEERYDELVEKCRPFWKLHSAIKEKFPDYQVEMSRGDRLSVNDKIIKGVTFYPGMFRLRENSEIEHIIQEHLDFITNEIQIDINKGRIKKGEYGTK